MLLRERERERLGEKNRKRHYVQRASHVIRGVFTSVMVLVKTPDSCIGAHSHI